MKNVKYRTWFNGGDNDDDDDDDDDGNNEVGANIRWNSGNSASCGESDNINHNGTTVPVVVPLAIRVPREIFRDALRAINVENGAVL
ncbi:unnamed protein product [Acanthocheilonema viteae]|uniref:Uncharacterized protein n=1 Tax=Acanthocheilonema viteae TaxID=6277 RepID=A0A498S3P2_ACAVI|nr:unnamed protein product [Acanthocheilonema viteae]